MDEYILINLGNGTFLIFSETRCITGDPREGAPILLPQVPGARRVVVISPQHAEEFLFDEAGNNRAMTERRFDIMDLANTAFTQRPGTPKESAPPVREPPPGLSVVNALGLDWPTILANVRDFRSWSAQAWLVAILGGICAGLSAWVAISAIFG